MLDFATSEVALGKVRVALNQEQQMAEGLLIDAAGNPTTDPSTMYQEPYVFIYSRSIYFKKSK